MGLKNSGSKVSTPANLKNNALSAVSNPEWHGKNQEGEISFGKQLGKKPIYNIDVPKGQSPKTAAAKFFAKLTAGQKVIKEGNLYKATFADGSIVTMRYETKSGSPAVEINLRYIKGKYWLKFDFIKYHFR